MVCTIVKSQTTAIDSLNQQLEATDQDYLKVKILLDISKQYRITDSTGMIYARKAYNLAQTIEVDSLIARSEGSLGIYFYQFEQDSARLLLDQSMQRYASIGLHNKVSDVYWNMSLVHELRSNYDSSIFYLEKSLEEATNAEYLLGIADANYYLATIHSTRGNNSLALKHSLQAKEYFEKAGKQKEVSWALNQTGIIYDYMGMYSDALDYYLQAREIAIDIKDEQGEILIINNLGVVYDQMKNTEKALEYYEEALEKSGIFEYKEDEATLLNNVSYIYLTQGDTIRAKNALWRSLAITKEGELPCFEMYPLEGLGSLYTTENQLDSASHYLSRALEKGKVCEDVGILTAVNKGLGEINAKRGNNKLALSSFLESLRIAKDAQLSNEALQTLLALSKFYKQIGDNTSALSYLEEHKSLSDSLEKNKTIEKANQLAAEYEFRKQVEELKAEQLASELALQKEIDAQAREQTYILVGMILLALLVISMGRSYYLIQKQNKKLKWLNEEKNTLMGVVAHDLRNPLNMIKGLMQMVVGVKTESDEDSQKYLHLIEMSTQKMTDMIDKVLDISAIENMKVNLNTSREDLTQLMQRVSDNFEFLAAKKKIKINKNYDETISLYSTIDANYFDQILDNLVSNGIKFSEKGKNIYLGLDTDEDYNVVSVKDEGPGISEEEQKTIFNKFRTTAAKPTSHEKSTGLGLSIVKKFVTAMDGEIACQSELGKGSTFYVKFKKA